MKWYIYDENVIILLYLGSELKTVFVPPVMTKLLKRSEP